MVTQKNIQLENNTWYRYYVLFWK